MVRKLKQLLANEKPEVVAAAKTKADEMLHKTPSIDTDMSTVLEKIEPWAGSRQEALKWYRTHTIAALGGFTAQELVERGRTGEVLEYLRHIQNGGYA